MPPWSCGELMPSGVRAMCDACDVDERLEEVAQKAIAELDLTGAFQADKGDSLTIRADGSGTYEFSDGRKVEYPAHQPPRTFGLHIYKHSGYWTIERLRDGELIESFVGVATIADALDRIGEWVRAV